MEGRNPCRPDEGCDRRRRRQADRERRRKRVQPAQARQGAGRRSDRDPFPFRRRRWVRLRRGRPAGAGRRHRPYKPKEEPAAYLGELLLKILEALHARSVVAKLVVLQLSSNPLLDPLLAERWLWPRSACRRRPVQECFGGRWASSSKWSWRSADVPARRTRRKPRRRCTKRLRPCR